MISIQNRITGVNELSRRLGQLSVYSNKSIGKEIRFSAARLAENLAVGTIPFGKSESSKKSGERSVSMDVMKVYTTPSRVYNLIKKSNPNLAEAFWATQKQGTAKGRREALDIYRKAGFNSVKGFSTVKAELHKSQRINGKVKKNSEQYIASNSDRLQTYIERKKRMVGFAKAGFTSCAKKLRRRVEGMQWVTRHNNKAPSNVVDNSKHPTNPSVYFENLIPYVSSLINNTTYMTALRKEYNSIDAQIRRIIDKSVKNI